MSVQQLRATFTASRFPVGDGQTSQAASDTLIEHFECLFPASRDLQFYMIMALMASLLMRLRCFLRRRGEAGRNGERRDDGLGAAVGTAERQSGERHI